jgi:hypothetical protein
VEVVNVAVAAVFSVPVPRTSFAFLNVTVPVGATLEEQLTTAVKTMLCPNNAGFTDELKLVVEGDTPLPVRFTANVPTLVLS